MITACSANEVPGENDAGDENDDAGSTSDTGDDSVRFLIAENFWADWAPYQSTAQSQARLETHIYDTLLQFPSGELDQPEPSLATEWEQVDETTWEFTLREGVTFHDGTPFTADDVKASVELASGATDVETVLQSRWVPTTGEIIDDHTIRLVTEEPFASLLNAVRQTSIVSSEDLEAGQDAMAQEPNGTGPFTLVDETETKKTMAANADYWNGPPAIEELVWEFVGDPQTRVSALLAGQADVIDRVPAEQHATIEGEDGYSLISATASEQVNLWSIPGRVSAWDESPELRRAVMLAIDRQALVDSLVMGESVVATSFAPEATLYHAAGSPAYEQDLDEARQLVQEAGAEGLEFELWVASGFLPRAEQVGEAIAANLNEIGLNVRVVPSDVAGLVDDSNSESGTGLLYHLSWSSGGDPDAATGIYATPNRWTAGDETIDRLVAEGKTTIDPQEREAVYAELQAYLWEQLPHIPLYNSDFTVAYSDRVRDLRVLPNYETDFYPASIGE
ncbi:ABC transporter substrate-binding protein [Phytoactinopolyspora halotolerans]|uniref:ABC transporter substrate-binding protein n=1 Tax=Phytoactinopolyspora halotolerans TaxID=1981512 RepID=A0A6L9SD30_9ACTN|nr:ABC transporter substrate-binding protein [Phytoactinopolyspora halotolerans]NEE03265.1 ABC transporter substrate-binding protein [Phytoactinopolyspora halotolerans]